MNVKLELTTNGLSALEQVRQDLERRRHEAAREGAEAARLMFNIGADAGIYDTPQGAHERTLHYRESFVAVTAVSAGQIIIECRNSAEYASTLEYGGVLTPQTTEQIATDLGTREEPLYMGRTGHLWKNPNPAVTRATVYAALIAMERLTSKT